MKELTTEQRSQLMSGKIDGMTRFAPIPSMMPERYVGRILELRAISLGWLEGPAQVDAANREECERIGREIARDAEHQDPAEIDAANRKKLAELAVEFGPQGELIPLK